jgi:hypothetical protein
VPANTDYILFNSQETIDIGTNPEIDQEQFYEAILKDGSLRYRIDAATNADAAVEISFPTIRKSGNQVLKIQFDILKFPSQPVEGIVSLAGYTIDFTTLAPKYNKFPLIYKVEVKGGESGVLVPTTSKFDLDVKFYNLDYGLTRGYFGKQTVELAEDVIKIGPLADIGGAEMSIVGAKIEMEVINDYRIPSEVDFKFFEARKGNDKLTMTTNPEAPMYINAPSGTETSASTILSVTNASDIFNFRPDNLSYVALATINPKDLNIENFIKDTDRLIVKLKAEAPLYGWAKGLSMMDTMDISLGDDLNFKVEKALMKLNIRNEFPLQATLQIYFTDENYVITDSLFITNDQRNIIMPSSVDDLGNLKSDGEGKYEKIIELSKSRFSNLMDASHLIMKTEMNTNKIGDTYPNVKFKAGYKLHVEIGIQTKLELSLKP